MRCRALTNLEMSPSLRLLALQFLRNCVCAGIPGAVSILLQICEVQNAEEARSAAVRALVNIVDAAVDCKQVITALPNGLSALVTVSHHRAFLFS